MTSSVGLLLLLLLCATVLVWLFRRPRSGDDADAEPWRDSAIDREALEEAEAEVQDLDAFLNPEDAEDELDDWGPGAPKT